MIFRRHPTALLAALVIVMTGAAVWAGLSPAQAPAASGWVQIEGQREISVAKQLRYRIFCRDACTVDITARIVWPTRPNLVNHLRGHLRPGESRANIITLNNVGLNVLRANYRRSRLQVLVRATNRRTGQSRTVRRGFRFTMQRNSSAPTDSTRAPRTPTSAPRTPTSAPRNSQS